MKQYIIKNNIKLIENNEKEEAFRSIWENIFKITPEENAQYDHDNGRAVRDYLNNNQEILATYNSSDLSRLQGNQNIDELISLPEIQATIKSFTNDTPGETPINKSVLQNLPISAHTKIQ